MLGVDKVGRGGRTAESRRAVWCFTESRPYYHVISRSVLLIEQDSRELDPCAWATAALPTAADALSPETRVRLGGSKGLRGLSEHFESIGLCGEGEDVLISGISASASVCSEAVLYSISAVSSSCPLLNDRFESAVLGVAQADAELLESSVVDVVSNVDSKVAKSGCGESGEERQRWGVGERGGSGMS